ncbi:hypothetical protein [Aestuariivita sp.]|jgi:hypothetical protein|uniref:hypothetical protein n=1 Tax=Aestuariivita sp. TaxID=1872407 RepID=UPI002172E43A|nr:hypothetical protein [Aestuariivita sp.]MCE8009863.1 hypothetical protein [Aestuariivita sp.]
MSNIDFSAVLTAQDKAAAHLDLTKMTARSYLKQVLKASVADRADDVPVAEQASWPAKALAAQAVSAGTASEEQIAMLTIEAEVTGESLADLAASILAKSAISAGHVARLTGLRRRAQRRIDAATDPTEVEAALDAISSALAGKR